MNKINNILYKIAGMLYLGKCTFLYKVKDLPIEVYRCKISKKYYIRNTYTKTAYKVRALPIYVKKFGSDIKI